MAYTTQYLAAMRKLTFGNEERLKSSVQAGCFDLCLSIFPVSQIKEWIDDSPQRTALCPNCGFDTVLPDDGTFEFSHDLLNAMNAYHMGPSDKPLKNYTSLRKLMRDYRRGKL